MKKVISEDSKMYNVNRQQSGSTARQDSKGETAPQPNTVTTFINANKRDDNSQAPDLKPYPLNLADDVLSDMFISAANLRKMLLNAESNPALKKKFIGNLNNINKRIDQINRMIVDISQELDKIK
jgi:TATA-binding protein-associated factor Taf7